MIGGKLGSRPTARTPAQKYLAVVLAWYLTRLSALDRSKALPVVAVRRHLDVVADGFTVIAAALDLELWASLPIRSPADR